MRSTFKMLVISRKKGESIRLGRDIIITITEIKSGKVSLGIKAPKSLEILRDSEGEGDFLAKNLPLSKENQKNS